nr:hypothetical protein CFP56_07506 [Quercus suber]
MLLTARRWLFHPASSCTGACIRRYLQDEALDVMSVMLLVDILASINQIDYKNVTTRDGTAQILMMAPSLCACIATSPHL